MFFILGFKNFSRKVVQNVKKDKIITQITKQGTSTPITHIQKRTKINMLCTAHLYVPLKY